jgi:mxaA protein
LLLRHYAKWPFTRRPNRPFTIADRRIRKLETGQSEGVYRESLIILHRAFDESFGRRLFATDIDAFLNDKQGFAALAHKLRRFFESSRLYFFSGDRTTAETMFPIQDVRQLATDLAREERTAA